MRWSQAADAADDGIFLKSNIRGTAAEAISYYEQSPRERERAFPRFDGYTRRGRGERERAVSEVRIIDLIFEAKAS